MRVASPVIVTVSKKLLVKSFRPETKPRSLRFQESHVDPSLAEKQRMLKKARLADQLNVQLSHRPGPLELIAKNILHTEETIETAVKSGTLAFKATSEGASGRPEHPSSYCGPPEEVSPSPSPPSTLSPASVASPPQHPAPGKDKNRKKSKQKLQPKARFKFHEYKGPPSAQKASSPPDSVETPYELLLQQQQMLLQLTFPASPAASIASDCSDAYPAPPPPPPLPLAPLIPVVSYPGAPLASRFEDMKVSDLRAECKRLNLRVSGPKPQLLERLRPFLIEKQEEAPKSPMSVASPADARLSESEPEDIVQSQRRQIEELERKLEASRQQLEAVRREAAGAAASDQSRRLLQAHLCVSQLRAQLDALQQSPAPPPPAPLPQPTRLVIARADATTPDRLVQLFTVTSPAQTANDGLSDTSPAKSQAYILNGVKVVPIAILPSSHYEPERAHPPPPSPPPPPPPPMPQISLPAPLTPLTPLSHDLSEDSQIMDDVLEILVENGELPASAVSEGTESLDTGYIGSAADTFSPAEMLGDTQIRETLAAEELQRELNDIQNEILNHADMNANSHHGPGIDSDLTVDLLASNDFHTEFCSSDPTVSDHDDFFGSLLSGDSNNHMESLQTPMDIGEDPPERMCMTPLPNGDILDHAQPGFEDMDDLSLPSFHNEESRHGPCDFDFKEVGIDFNTNMSVDNDFMGAQLIPNLFGRGHMPQCDPLLAGVLAPAPRPARKHYSWDKQFDAT